MGRKVILFFDKGNTWLRPRPAAVLIMAVRVSSSPTLSSCFETCWTFRQSGRGAIYVYYGNTNNGMNLCPDFTHFEGQAGAQLGYSVWGGIDVNADGYAEIIAGLPYYDATYADQGRALCFKGSLGSGISLGWTITPPENQAGSRFGFSVSGGHCDSRAGHDLVIGSPYWDDTAPNDDKGKVVIWYFNPDTGAFDIWDLVGSGNPSLTGEHFGSSVAHIEKINLSASFNEACILTGAPEANPTFSNEGMATINRYQP